MLILANIPGTEYAIQYKSNKPVVVTANISQQSLSKTGFIADVQTDTLLHDKMQCGINVW
jgi:hypothetical protein